jgi:hypothetical protein
MTSKMKCKRLLTEYFREIVYSCLQRAYPDVLACLFKGALDIFVFSFEFKKSLRLILFFEWLV